MFKKLFFCAHILICTSLISMELPTTEDVKIKLPKMKSEATVRETQLLRAAAAGDVAGVTNALAFAPVNTTDEKDRTALHWSAKNNHLEIIKFLLEKGADQSASTSGKTPLQKAAKHGNLLAVKLLIDAKKELSRYDQYYALVEAAKNGHVDVVKVLLNYRKADKGASPLHMAAAEGEIHLLVLLLDEDLYYLETLYCGFMTPLDFAISDGQGEAALELIAVGALQTKPLTDVIVNHIKKSYEGFPLLIAVLCYDKNAILDHLTETNSNISDKDLQEALQFAISKGDKEIILLLLPLFVEKHGKEGIDKELIPHVKRKLKKKMVSDIRRKQWYEILEMFWQTLHSSAIISDRLAILERRIDHVRKMLGYLSVKENLTEFGKSEYKKILDLIWKDI